MTSAEFQHQILAEAAGGTVVLTATRRLARQLLEIDRRVRTAAGAQAWVRPAILASPDWLAEQLRRLGVDWRALASGGARRLWEEIIEEDVKGAGFELLQVAASAARAQEAHQLLVDYRVALDGQLLSDDHAAFLRWQTEYRRRLAAGGWDDPAGQAWTVAAALETGQLECPVRLLLAGFDQVPPGLQRIVTLLGPERARILPSASCQTGRALRAGFPDLRSEVRAAACWARHLLEQGGARIGVVVPDLPSYRDTIEQVFREEIDPQALFALCDEESRFGLSLGMPLGQLGPVAAALAVLGCRQELEVEALSRLVRSPYLGGAESEGPRREGYDVSLRRLRRQRFSLRQLQASHRDGHLPLPPRLQKILVVLENSLNVDRPARPGLWAERFRSLLQELGWPGERVLDSRDYQIVRHWEEKLLPRFAALDEVSRPMRREEAVSCLRRMALEEVFQQEMPDPGIQVCGVLEAGGLEFAQLWVLGLHENAWPLPPRPNPFLPLRLQVDNRMPRADAAGEEDYARQTLQRLLAAAPEVICSYPEQDGANLLRPSRLLLALPEGVPPQAQATAPALRLNSLGPEPEILADRCGTPLAAGAELAGGTALLRDQARCPFRAFARHRLGARSLEQPSPGLDPATRGTLVHRCLELFWQRAQTHARLRGWDAPRRHSELAASVDAALAAETVALAALPPALFAIERERLIALLEEWLAAAELERPAQAVAVATEEGGSATCGGLNITTKVDRCDRLEDGRLLILDYKTGQVELDDLLGERLLEPQLPIYAVNAGAEALAGIGIGILKRGDCKLVALARDGDLFSRVAAFDESKAAAKHQLADWEALKRHWQGGLDTLGEEIREGLAAVTPVSLQKACRSCDLSGLCRVDEASAGHEEMQV